MDFAYIVPLGFRGAAKFVFLGASLLVLRHSQTGKVIEIDTDPGSRSMYRFRQACRALDRKSRRDGLQVYFGSLTLSDDHLGTTNRDLDKFLQFIRQRMRRSGSDFFYVWAVELQKRRYKKYGKAALHWHFAFACKSGALPHCEFNQSSRIHYRVVEDGQIVSIASLVRNWGLGQVFFCKAWSRSVYGYIGKYLEKDYSQVRGFKAEWSSLRRFGSSNMGLDRLPDWALSEVEKWCALDGGISDLSISRQGGRISAYGFETVRVFGLDVQKRVRVLSARSPWHRLVGGVGGESQSADA